MPAQQAAPQPRHAAFLPGQGLAGQVRLRSWPRAAAALSAVALVAGTALAGCEYHYDDGWRPALSDVSEAPAVIESRGAREPWRHDPVSEAAMEAWLERSQLGDGLQVAHRGYGLLRAGEIRTEITEGLPAGTYVLALSCRGREPVKFTVSTEKSTVVDISWRCGPRRQSVIHLPAEAVLTVQVEAEYEANYAYRLSWL